MPLLDLIFPQGITEPHGGSRFPSARAKLFQNLDCSQGKTGARLVGDREDKFSDEERDNYL